jgi:hypothetical protein
MKRAKKQRNDELSAPGAVDEFAGLELGDRRLETRTAKVVACLAKAPEKSLPQAMADDAELQAAYRLMSNRRVSVAALLGPHVSHAATRVADAAECIVAHDTTEFEFGGSIMREGLGNLRTPNDQGFLAHISFAVDADSQRPLGTLAVFTWTRKLGVKSRRNAAGNKKSGRDYAKESGKESARWYQQVEAAANAVEDPGKLIHVMDREADAYELLSKMAANGHRVVVRLRVDRAARNPETLQPEHVRALAERAPDEVLLEVPISRRAKTTVPAAAKTFGEREARVAKLAFRATTIEIRRPSYVDKNSHPDWLRINVVQVHEIDCPEDQEPVEWTLLTSEPIDTPEAIRRAVRLYQGRWLIEEFFKALKTGCEYEKSQLESYGALLNLLAICLPIAWQLLLLRNLARTEPDAPATQVLTPTQIEVLRNQSRLPIPHNPTVGVVALAVAVMGGYIRSRRPYGWLTLGRGLEKLITLTAGWIAAKAQEPIG